MRQATNPVKLEPPDLAAESVILAVDPVERARQYAAQFAVADMRLSIALTHGTDPEVLETLKAGSRLIAELAHKRLSILGLKSGESVALEPSERLEEALARWQALRGAPVDQAPGEVAP